ncbi:MAG TPA: 3-dehydroquinate synthase [Opitutaceae bacterium]|jgi:3-dehydroquinate synthase
MPDTLQVNLGERSYPILFAEDLAPEVRAQVAELDGASRRIAVITDRNVADIQASTLRSFFGSAPRLVVPSGEESKSLAEFGRALDFLASEGLDRSGAVFAVGGGVVGDLAGFAAASYLRGVDYFQVPTTLLSMVDSSVGGKTGVNLKAGKNLAGAFHQPRRVFISTGFLKLLPAKEFSAGMAEVIKTALLGDRLLFEDLERSSLTASDMRLAWVVRVCCGIKAALVEADEQERADVGGRALLNLGHTFGHAIEQVTGYGAYLHGEAVAIGLCAAAELSVRLGMLSPADVLRIGAIVVRHGLPVRLRSPLATGSLMAAMARDKKARAGALRFVVLESIGKAVVRGDVPTPDVEAAWRAVGCT